MSVECNSYQPNESFMRVAAACPEVAVGDIETNTARIAELYAAAAKQDASLVVFPELSLTSYTIGDLVQQKSILAGAEAGLLTLAERTKDSSAAMIVGLPVAVDNAIYNCAAVVSGGQIRGIVPKTNLPNYKEFYEKRWFQSWDGQENTQVMIGDQCVPFGTDLLFQIGEAKVGVEVCEDLWVAQPPSERLAGAGATIIANPSASPEQIAKSTYRRQLVAQQSGRLLLGYVYAGCDASESTTDLVMSGHQIIAENGHILAERAPLSFDQRLTVTDIDLDHLTSDRRRDTNFANTHTVPVIPCEVTAEQHDIYRDIDPEPFVPKGAERNQALQSVLDIQAQALATRLRNTNIEKMVLGLSGGLDSTLALLVAVRAAERLGKEPADLIQTLTMPGEASSEQTQGNAVRLAQALGIVNEVIPIAALAQDHLKVLGHDGVTKDITYENVQARLRTSILFNRANQIQGLVLGTGDLSEIALGWCTYNGDHMSHYNVNASIPKTLVKHLVSYAAGQLEPGSVQAIVRSILDTPISPELVGDSNEGISQQTEELIGPYELHDFFLYHLVRWGDEPRKIARLAEEAFGGSYTPHEIHHWLEVFLTRFTQNQWKRSVATDGPKVGSVSLSPRGDWRMPSDMQSAFWKK